MLNVRKNNVCARRTTQEMANLVTHLKVGTECFAVMWCTPKNADYKIIVLLGYWLH